jgi:NAD(P)-dependent dehydrogenase (short-subunit alcohol dehydrogenase family)
MAEKSSPVVLVTGATDGIGLETAAADDAQLARRFYEVSVAMAGVAPLPG